MDQRYGARVQFGVFRKGDDWKLCCNGFELRRFLARGPAIVAAEKAANMAVGSGFEPEIYVHEDTELVRLPRS